MNMRIISLRKEYLSLLPSMIASLFSANGAWQRLLKVARTIADIDQSDIITRQHLQEAVSYRAIDRLLIHLQKLLT